MKAIDQSHQTDSRIIIYIAWQPAIIMTTPQTWYVFAPSLLPRQQRRVLMLQLFQLSNNNNYNNNIKDGNLKIQFLKLAIKEQQFW